MKYLGIDFETANSERASICSVGLLLVDESFNHIMSKEVLVNPECDFDVFNIMIHGITPDMVIDSPTFPQVLDLIQQNIDDDTVVVCHNAGFDMSVFRKSCVRYNLSPISFPYVCTYVLTRHLIPGKISYSLDSLIYDFNLPSFSHHDALEDTKACLSLLHYLIDTNGSKNAFDLCDAANCSVGKIIDAEKYIPCKHFPDIKKSKVSLFDYSSINKDASESHPFYNKVIVFTGTLSSCTRIDAFKMVADVGGIPSDSLSKKTNYLVTGYQRPEALNGHEKSNKRMKAEQYLSKGADIQIISESEFYEIMSDSYTKLNSGE